MRYLLVTTKYRGVFFGELSPKDEKGTIVIIRNARNCVSWSQDCHGVFGLAANGPTSNCRVGPAVPSMKLRGVVSITDCTNTAVTQWEKEPWN